MYDGYLDEELFVCTYTLRDRPRIFARRTHFVSGVKSASTIDGRREWS